MELKPAYNFTRRINSIKLRELANLLIPHTWLIADPPLVLRQVTRRIKLLKD
jgi:hypothetical protein